MTATEASGGLSDPLSGASSVHADSPRRRSDRLGRMPSDGSQRSGSSSTSSSSRSGEGVKLRPPGRTHRHLHRLSGVFLRGPDGPGPGPMALRPSLSGHLRKGSVAPARTPGGAEDPSELSTQKTAPGILKVFGSEICEGAHYKSVLATTHSSAKELVKEALERYGLGKEEAQRYVLCDSIGVVRAGSQWETEAFRVVGDNEKPLLLQSLWKPREGLVRRFEIQRRSSVDEKRSKEKDTVTAGINAQARRLQKSRSRVTPTLAAKTPGGWGAAAAPLWRSRSEMDLLDGAATPDPAPPTPPSPGGQPGRRGDPHHHHHHHHRPNHHPDPGLDTGRGGGGGGGGELQDPGVSHPGGAGGAAADTERLCGEERRRRGQRGERGESGSSEETQYSIHPPRDCPYLLLLRGYAPAKEFVLYLLTGPSTVIGRGSEQGHGSEVDIPLFAPDIRGTHCCLRRPGGGGPALLRPSGGAVVTRNGEAVGTEAELSAGDVIGMGGSYVFLFKNPSGSAMAQEVNGSPPEPSVSSIPRLLGNAKSTASPAHTSQPTLCHTCSSARVTPDRPSTACPQALRDAEGRDLALTYHAAAEASVVEEIVAMGGDGPALTAAFLMSVCVQSAARRRRAAGLRRLLLLIAANAQGAVWERSKELAEAQAHVDAGAEGAPAAPLQWAALTRLMAGLRPLVLWMSNALELLNVIQNQLPLLLDWRSGRGEGREQGGQEEEEHSALLSCVRGATQETVGVLEEIVMLTFQQCVYYITKVLHPILPGVLNHNPFADSARPAAPQETRGGAGGHGQTRGPVMGLEVLEVLSATGTLLHDCQVHPEVGSQLLAYLLFFTNASLFNALMERGSEPGYYQWSRGIRIRANLDELLDWVHAWGLAPDHLGTLSSAVNLLATPREVLLQTSWAALRSDYPGLREAQLHHLLVHYSPASAGSQARTAAPAGPQAWTPGPADRAAALRTEDILGNFDNLQPLVLPGEGYQLGAGAVVTDRALGQQLGRLQEFISRLSDATSSVDSQDRVVPAEAKRIHMAVLPSPSLEVLEDPPPLMSPPPRPARPLAPPPPSSSPAHGGPEEDRADEMLLLSRTLQILEPGREDEEEEEEEEGPGGAEQRGGVVGRSRLPSPPGTPCSVELVITEEQPHAGEGEEVEATWLPAQQEIHEEGSLMSEFLAALTADRSSLIGALKEEEEEEEEKEEEDLVFDLELERGDRGLGLALVDARAQDTTLNSAGILIRAVVPDSPAGRCERLFPGDRILAVNGTSLLGMDLDLGKELIQASGGRPRLLVARSDWTARGLHSAC